MKRKLYPQTQHRGFVTLVAVLVVGALGLSIAVAILLLGLGASRSSFTSEQSAQARALANACVEAALMQIRNSQSFIGTNSLVFNQGSCLYGVTNTGGQNRLVNTTGTVSTTVPYVIRKARVTLDAVSPKINITSWQEVPD